MIEFISGDILKSDSKILVNPVNCVGVMGKGLALKFKDKFPKNYKLYKEACKRGRVRIGSPFVFSDESSRYILNFPTKEHWRDPSYIENIEIGLEVLKKTLTTLPELSISIPALGCGCGELDWEQNVKPLLIRELSSLEDISIQLYEPY